jgi:hypothetical protein
VFGIQLTKVLNQPGPTIDERDNSQGYRIRKLNGFPLRKDVKGKGILQRDKLIAILNLSSHILSQDTFALIIASDLSLPLKRLFIRDFQLYQRLSYFALLKLLKQKSLDL